MTEEESTGGRHLFHWSRVANVLWIALSVLVLLSVGIFPGVDVVVWHLLFSFQGLYYLLLLWNWATTKSLAESCKAFKSQIAKSVEELKVYKAQVNRLEGENSKLRQNVDGLKQQNKAFLRVNELLEGSSGGLNGVKEKFAKLIAQRIGQIEEKNKVARAQRRLVYLQHRERLAQEEFFVSEGVRDLFNETDLSGDGSIQKEEYENLVEQLAKFCKEMGMKNTSKIKSLSFNDMAKGDLEITRSDLISCMDPHMHSIFQKELKAAKKRYLRDEEELNAKEAKEIEVQERNLKRVCPQRRKSEEEALEESDEEEAMVFCEEDEDEDEDEGPSASLSLFFDPKPCPLYSLRAQMSLVSNERHQRVSPSRCERCSSARTTTLCLHRRQEENAVPAPCARIHSKGVSVDFLAAAAASQSGAAQDTFRDEPVARIDCAKFTKDLAADAADLASFPTAEPVAAVRRSGQAGL